VLVAEPASPHQRLLWLRVALEAHQAVTDTAEAWQEKVTRRQEVVTAAWRAGISAVELADHLGVSRTVIHRLIARNTHSTTNPKETR
jgi:predicted DNA-binding protein YlxM (UPF0122 family)